MLNITITSSESENPNWGKGDVGKPTIYFPPVEHRCLLPVGPAGQKGQQTETENADPMGTGACRM